MDAFLDLWWVFPVSIGFATVAVGSGVSATLFFSPFFMLVVGLSPAQAIGTGLLVQAFGMGNGLRAYVRQRVVDYATARWVLAAAVPTALIGAFLAHEISGHVLKVAFGLGLLVLAGVLVVFPAPEAAEPASEAREDDRARLDPPLGETTVIEARDGTVYEYVTCSRRTGVTLAGVGGFLTGLVSAGLPEITTTQLIVRCRLPPRVAIATSVFTLAITTLAAAVVHALAAAIAWNVVGWSVPGVLIGSSTGSRIGKWIPADLMEKLLGGVFAAVGAFVVWLELG